MGNVSPIGNNNVNGYNHRKELYNVSYTKIPIWHLPKNIDCTNFDTDNTKWLESINKDGENEIDSFEHSSDGRKTDLSKYAMNTKITIYNDNSIEIKNTAKRYTMTENCSEHTSGIFINVNLGNRLVAEKIYNTEQDDGRKIVHLHGRSGDNKFEVVKIYNFQLSKNKATDGLEETDIVNFMYTSEIEKFISDAEFEKEYYMLNGREVKAEKTGDYQYRVTDNDNNTLIFNVR